MAYETASVNTISDLITALVNFAVTNGWTQDELVTASGKAAIHKDGQYISFGWATSSPTCFGIFQATGYTGGNVPGTHPGSDGSYYSGGTNTSWRYGRHVELFSNGVFDAYYFFTDATGSYIHGVVEYQTGRYQHFGFGVLDKLGTWTGGQYAYGFNNVGSFQGSSFLMNGVANTTFSGSGEYGRQAPTMVCTGIANTVYTSSYCASTASSTQSDYEGSNNHDYAGNVRGTILADLSEGIMSRGLAYYSASLDTAYIPLIPVHLWYRNVRSTLTINELTYLGKMKDVRVIQMANLNDEQEISVGGDTWKVFPARYRSLSGDFGAAYKIVT